MGVPDELYPDDVEPVSLRGKVLTGGCPRNGFDVATKATMTISLSGPVSTWFPAAS